MELLLCIAVSIVAVLTLIIAGFEMFFKILKGRGFFSSKEDYIKMVEVNTN